MSKSKMMTLATLTAVLAVLTITPAETQALTINPQIGLNFSALDSELENTEHEVRTGWSLGGNVRINDTKKLYVQTGLFIKNIGSELTSTENPDASSLENSIHTLQWPVLAGWDIVRGSSFQLRLQAGGSFNKVLSVDENDVFTEDDVKSHFWSSIVAVGIDIAMVTLDVGYDWSRNEFFENTDVDDGKMNNFFLNAGIKF